MSLTKSNREFKNYSEVEFDFWHNHIDALQLKDCEEVLIFGCGMWGKALYKEINKHINIRIKGFCDNNQALQGKKIEECFIYSAQDGRRKYPNAIYVIAVDKYANAIKKQLTELEICEEHIRIFDTYNSGEAARKYFSERLNERYFLDNNYPSEAFVPVIKNVLAEDKRDFRVHIEEGLANTFDHEIDPLKEDIMNQYEDAYGKYNGTECISTDGEGKTKVRVMIACSHKDRAGLSKDNEMYYVPVQVGKALTDICLYDECDDAGDNISDRNYNYSECTALYWAWKNHYALDADYIGLRHYRRKYDITDEQLCHLKENKVDIVHLDPIYHNNIKKSFVYFTKNENDWILMKSVIEKRFPEYYPAMLAYENQHFICAYNMTIMRRNIFDDYCCFLFGVLLEIEAYYLERCDRRDRYLGYLAENLTSIYLMHNKDKFKQIIAKLVPVIKP